MLWKLDCGGDKYVSSEILKIHADVSCDGWAGASLVLQDKEDGGVDVAKLEGSKYPSQAEGMAACEAWARLQIASIHAKLTDERDPVKEAAWVELYGIIGLVHLKAEGRFGAFPGKTDQQAWKELESMLEKVVSLLAPLG